MMAIRATSLARIAGTTLVALVLGTGATAGAAQAADTVAPSGAVGGLQSPVRGTLQLRIEAFDTESGLAATTAFIDGVKTTTAVLGTGCAPATETDSAPAQPSGCVREVKGAALPVDLSAAAVGPHRLQVRVADAAGNETTVFDGDIAVAGPEPVSSSTVTVAVGDPNASGGGSPGSGSGSGSGSQNPSNPLSGTTPTPLSSVCPTPRLSVWLDQKPVRVSNGKPVLVAKRRYRYRGRLTCVIDGKRRSAPTRTPVEILFKVRGRTHLVSGTTTTGKGRITVILAYPSARTIIFRHRSTTGTSVVRIPIVITKKAPKR